VRENGTQEEDMTCQSKATSITCSTAPEMFETAIGTTGRVRIECLTHAVASESRGRTVDVIRR
jgi:hypothetical protein